MADETLSDEVDSRVNDPNFLLCLALSYLGLPPGLWRMAVNSFLQAVSEEYKQRYGAQRGSKEFKVWENGFRAWSSYNKFKVVIVFLGESKIGPILISNATAKAIRKRVLVRLAAYGVKEAAILGASQIIRKVTIYLEIAWITGCATFCASAAAIKQIEEFTLAAASALVMFQKGVKVFVDAIVTEIIARPFLIARAMLDPSNWDTSPMQSGAPLLQRFGNSLWSQVNSKVPDVFISNLSKSLREFSIPRNSIDQIAAAMTSTVNARGGMNEAITFQTSELLNTHPLSFVQLLKDWRLLNFRSDPEKVANVALGRQ
jgi:hypothetical protein